MNDLTLYASQNANNYYYSILDKVRSYSAFSHMGKGKEI